jgi:hypothetical protein
MTEPCTISADPHFFYLTIPGRAPISIPSHRGDILARILSARTIARERGLAVGIGTAGSPTQEMIRAYGAALARNHEVKRAISPTQAAAAKAAEALGIEL